jgi:translation initiation factor 2 alpha subunit (eIF-2alpha)
VPHVTIDSRRSEEKLSELTIDDEKVKNNLMDELKRRFKRPVIKTMANFSVSCRSFEGIKAIKRALHSGIEGSKEKGYDVKIFIIGAPKYTCEVSSATIEAGREALHLTLQAVEKSIKESKGDFVLDKQPYVVGDSNQHIIDMIKNEMVEEVVDGDDSDMGEADD